MSIFQEFFAFSSVFCEFRIHTHERLFSVAVAGVHADVVIPAVANIPAAVGFLMFLVAIIIVVGV